MSVIPIIGIRQRVIKSSSGRYNARNSSTTDNAAGVVLHHNIAGQWHCAFHASAYGPEGAILAHNNLNDWYFPLGAAKILKMIKQMVSTGKVDDSINDMIEAVAVVNAGRLSIKEGSQAVSLSEIQ